MNNFDAARAQKLDALMPKLEKVLRMLVNGSDGEVVNAVRLGRVILAGVGLDFHIIIERLLLSTVAEMRKPYDQGYAKGRAEGVAEGRRSAMQAIVPLNGIGSGNGINGYSWMQVAMHCASNSHVFREKDRAFVVSMPRKIQMYGDPSPKQADWLGDLFNRYFSGRID